MNILVVDDEKEIADVVELYLQNEYHVLKFYTGQEALECIEKTKVDLAILDVMLPDIDGYEVCKRIRQFSHCPILFLSSKNDEVDKILGLAVGGDDYVTKPFNPLELVARVKSQLRRYTTLSSYGDEEGNVYEAGGLLINDDLKKVIVDGEEVKLTPIEYNILLLLLKNVLFIINTSYFLLTYYYFSFWSFYILIFFSYIN